METSEMTALLNGYLKDLKSLENQKAVLSARLVKVHEDLQLTYDLAVQAFLSQRNMSPYMMVDYTSELRAYLYHHPGDISRAKYLYIGDNVDFGSSTVEVFGLDEMTPSGKVIKSHQHSRAYIPFDKIHRLY